MEHAADPHPDFVVQFDEEVLALEAQLADLRPAEGVDFGVSLEPKKEEFRSVLTCRWG